MSALVHQAPSLPAAVRRRHATFIAKRLALSFAGLAVAPFFLAFKGAPSGPEALVFAFAFAPLAAALVAARTGRLALAHAVAALGLVALAATLSLGLGCGAACAIAWLVAAQVEAALATDTKVTLGTLALNIAALACCLVLAPKGGGAAADASFAALAFLYAAFVSTGAAPAAVEEPAIEADEIGTWRTAARLLDDAVVLFDAAGGALRVPADADARLGVAASDLMGRGLFEHLHVGDRPAFLKAIADAAHDDIVTSAKLRLRRSGLAAGVPSTHLWLEMRARRVEAGTGLPSVVALLRDGDAAEAKASEVATAQRSVEEAVQSKDHFLANMSHELRTPLNAIIGFSEMLGSRTLCPADPEKQREYGRIIHQSGQHLLSVVNSILDMSKLRSGTFALLEEPFDLVPLIDMCCDMIELKANEGRVRLTRDYPEALEEMVGDKRACKQILINLLSNAVKFTPEHGEVTVAARPDGNAVVIAVSDNGVGIGAADLVRLGDPFFQARSSLSRPFEGTGLGLSVVRGLVGLHGGTIALESEPGRGTRVTVRLPLDCRQLDRTRQSAEIETIPRRRAPEPAPMISERRIKQSA